MVLRIAFMGTPDFAVPTLSEILGAGHDVVCVYSQPPRPKGRGYEVQPSPVHAFADASGIPVRTPTSLKSPEEQAAFAALELDLAVVVAYGLLLPKPILEAPRLGCLNLHASLLPRWRGAAPIHRAILAGDTETGVMVMQMEEGLDTGPVLLGERVPIGPETTGGALHDTLSRIGASLMVRALAALERGALQPTPQPAEGATYAKKLTKEDMRLDWARPAAELHRIVRAFAPQPGAFFEATIGREPLRVKVLSARLVEGRGAPGTLLASGLTIACGEGALELLEVQKAGKGPVSGDAFLRGTSLQPGDVLVVP